MDRIVFLAREDLLTHIYIRQQEEKRYDLNAQYVISTSGEQMKRIIILNKITDFAGFEHLG